MNSCLTMYVEMIWDGTYTASNVTPVNLQYYVLAKISGKPHCVNITALALDWSFALPAAAHANGWATQQEVSSRSAMSGVGLTTWRLHTGDSGPLGGGERMRVSFQSTEDTFPANIFLH